MPFLRFLTYNNAVPIALGLLFLGAGGAFAATNPESILASEQRVLSVDNTYIVNKNLSSYTPTVQIVEVTEDEETYYVAYQFSTIALQDHVWQDVVLDRVMEVDKAVLGDDLDLGLYVTEQLRQIIEREIAYLREVQQIERQQVSNKVVATAYSGLVGAFLDERTEQLPGYTPVVTPRPDASSSAEARGGNGSTGEGNNANSGQQTSGGLSMQILGNNPARVPVGSTYNDLGAVVTDADGDARNVEKLLDGELVDHIDIDTSEPGSYVVTYRSVDTNSGASVESSRDIIVFSPEETDSGGGEQPSGSGTAGTSTGTTTGTSTGSGSTGTSTSTSGGAQTATTTSGGSGSTTATTTQKAEDKPPAQEGGDETADSGGAATTTPEESTPQEDEGEATSTQETSSGTTTEETS